MYRLEDAILQQHGKQLQDSQSDRRPIVVAFSNSTEEEIRSQHADLIHKIKTEKDEEGLYIYHPHDPKDILYNFETTTNIIKMWHNLESVWKLMESHEQQKLGGTKYDQVAMIRLDSVYVTPIDIFHYDDERIRGDDWKKTAVIPGFARFPVNDRLVYGPREAVKMWSNRFDLIDYHIQNARAKHKAIGLHSEHFLDKTVFPLLRVQGYAIVTDDDMCFLRARADNVLWVLDCKNDRNVNTAHAWMNDQAQMQTKVEMLLGKKCVAASKFISKPQLQCR